MNGRARTTVSDDTKTMSPRPALLHRGHERADQAVGADHGEVELHG